MAEPPPERRAGTAPECQGETLLVTTSCAALGAFSGGGDTGGCVPPPGTAGRGVPGDCNTAAGCTTDEPLTPQSSPEAPGTSVGTVGHCAGSPPAVHAAREDAISLSGLPSGATGDGYWEEEQIRHTAAGFGAHQAGVGPGEKRVHAEGELAGNSSGDTTEGCSRGSLAEASKRFCIDGTEQIWRRAQGGTGANMNESSGAGPSTSVHARPQDGLLGLPGLTQLKSGDARMPQAFAPKESTPDVEEEEVAKITVAAAEGEDKDPSPGISKMHDGVSLQQRDTLLGGAASTTAERRAQVWAEAPLVRVGWLPPAVGPGTGSVGSGSQATAGAGVLGPRSPRLVMEPSVGRLGAPRSAQTFFSAQGRLSSQRVNSSMMMMAPRYPWHMQRPRSDKFM